MMRKYLIAGNWKMNKTIGEAVDLAKKVMEGTKYVENEVAICPPFTALYAVYQVIKNSHIKLGAQNVWYEKAGAYTGEISPLFLKDIGCEYVIIGHSERRKYIKESDEIINKKIKLSIECGLNPIVCIGETIEEREKGITYNVLKGQFLGAFKNIDKEEFASIIIAYEPVWAIGTGRTATPETAEEAQKFIRKLIKESYGEEVAENTRILYGGSVTPENIAGLIKEPDIDGALVGGASLKADSFIKIVKLGKE